MNKKFLSRLLALLIALSLISCSAPKSAINSASAQATTGDTAAQATPKESAESAQKERSTASKKLKAYLDADPALLELMKKSIAKAHEINPDKNYNPVTNIEELYDFIDWNVKALPWQVLSDAPHKALYDHIDQGVDYIWFLFDQPLDELQGKGYYYPTL